MPFCKFAELVCAVGVVPIENEQPVPIADIAGSRLWLKVALEPSQTEFLVCPPFRRDGDAAMPVSMSKWRSEKHEHEPSMARVFCAPLKVPASR
jgi:hypothetical protein